MPKELLQSTIPKNFTSRITKGLKTLTTDISYLLHVFLTRTSSDYNIKLLAKAISKAGKEAIKFLNYQDSLRLYFALKGTGSELSLSIADKSLVSRASSLVRNRVIATIRKDSNINSVKLTDKTLDKYLSVTL